MRFSLFFLLFLCFFLCLRAMDGPQHICDVEWVDPDGHGGSESFFSAKEDDGQAASPSPSLAQKGVVADVEGKKSGRSRSRSSSGGIVQIREKKVKSDPLQQML
jgi:hypothetical protein